MLSMAKIDLCSVCRKQKLNFSMEHCLNDTERENGSIRVKPAPVSLFVTNFARIDFDLGAGENPEHDPA